MASTPLLDPYSEMGNHLKELKKHTDLLNQINEDVKTGKRELSGSDRTTVRALRNKCNRAIRDGKRLLTSGKMTDQGRREKMSEQFLQLCARYTSVSETSLGIERKFRQKMEEKRSQSMQKTLDQHHQAGVDLGFEEDLRRKGAERQQQEQLYQQKAPYLSQRSGFELKELDTSDQAFLDELNCDINECVETLDQLKGIMSELKINVETQGEALKGVEDDFDDIDGQIEESVEILDETPCYCCRSCCQCCTCWNSVMCTIA